MSEGQAASPAPVLTRHEVVVLLVDDQAMVAEAVRRMLAPEAGIAYHAIQDPTKALQTALSLKPTIILQDLVMPEVDGLALLKFYRAHPKLKDVPVIVLSTREEPQTKAEAFALGASDYLVKLPDRIELIARIRHHSQGYIHLLERNEAYQALLKSQQILAKQIARAAQYVLSLLPAPLPEGAVRTDWTYEPSAELGGDSFGYHWLDAEHFAVYLLDVCDHGVGPALLSVSVLNLLRSGNLPQVDFRRPAEVLAALNRAFPMEEQNDLYFTIWYGVWNRSTNLLTYASGGHPPALLLAPGGELTELRTSNPMIGGFTDISFSEASLPVAPGSKLYVFSDGIYEVSLKDGGMWDLEGLKAGLRDKDGTGVAPEALYNRIMDLHGSRELEDDFSLVRLSLGTE